MLTVTPMKAHLHAAMALITHTELATLLEAYGVPRSDLKLLQAHSPWSAGDRHTCRRVLDAILHGALDTMGLPRVTLSAEYVAAWIAIQISPINWAAACVFLDGAKTSHDLRGDDQHLELADGLTAERLLAHVHHAYEAMQIGMEVYGHWREALARTFVIPVEAPDA